MNNTKPPLLIIGASARAAAFSAANAGFRPYWIDEFGDVDLSDRFIGRRLDPTDYPTGIPAAARTLPAMPFLYTGAMENHRRIIDALSRERELLGNNARACEAVRDPFRLQQCLRKAGLMTAEVTTTPSQDVNKSWLCKPLGGAGGLGIRFHTGPGAAPAGHYLQEFVQGRSVAAVYIGDGRRAYLLGVTRQLVGKAAFRAARFSYCGSLGPLPLSEAERRQWQCLGDALTATFGLNGLFGVDAVQRRETIIPVEVNPRYTASVEVIEAGTDQALMAYHVGACRGPVSIPEGTAARPYGKCYLFAPESLTVRHDLRAAPMPCELDAVQLADVPIPGTVIRAGAPVLSLHARGRDQLDCLQLLTAKAAAILEKLQVISYK